MTMRIFTRGAPTGQRMCCTGTVMWRRSGRLRRVSTSAGKKLTLMGRAGYVPPGKPLVQWKLGQRALAFCLVVVAGLWLRGALGGETSVESPRSEEHTSELQS